MLVALITAGGVGSRMNMEIPKQFLHVYDKPLLIYTLEKFQNHPSVDKIAVATLPAWVDVVKSYAKHYKITKLSIVTNGGATGQESIYNGINAINKKYAKQKNVNVMIHDGNRCMVSNEIISDSIVIFKKNKSAVAAIPCVEAVFKSNDDGNTSTKSIPREHLFRTQTPHTYTLKKLLWAHEQAKKRKIVNTTASCSLMEMLGETIYFSKGSETNLKITTQDDLQIFEALLQKEKELS